MIGARTVMNGSPANTGVPSGTANTSPVKRNPASISKNASLAYLNCGMPAQVGDLLRCNAEVEQIVDGLREPGGQNEIAIVRQAPHGEFEGRAVVRFPGLEIAGSHGELVKIGDKAEAHYFFFVSGCASRTSPTACRNSLTTLASNS